jgi:NCS1 family nucleobase:cation symporter-1
MTVDTEQPDATYARREAGAATVETNGVNQIAEAERKGKPRDLFWPWFAANISVLSISYGSFILAFGISFWQSLIAVAVGLVVSYLFCGYIAISGKHASAPTMTISRSAFGIRGNRLPAAVSWLLTLGWETALAALAVLATATIFNRLGWHGGSVTKVVAVIVIIGLIAGGGTLGFDVIMRMQKWITWIAGILTVVYMISATRHINLHTVSHLPSGGTPAFIGAILFIMTGYGLGWVNAAADYSRYLPRSVSSRGVMGWTTFGSALGPFVLLVFGLFLAGSSHHLSQAIAVNPVGALATILPTWLLIPFVIVTVSGLVGGAVMDIYSSGLSLLNAGLRAPRWVAVSIDATLMSAGCIYVVFVSTNFLNPFQGALITLGVPIAAWCGVFLADILLRRTDYSEIDLFDRTGRYGDVRWMPLALIIVSTVLGWGLVTNTEASWLTWQGYLLGPFGLGGTHGQWAYANLGVIVALAMGFGGYLLLGRSTVRAQELLPLTAEVPLSNEQAQDLGREGTAV